MLRTLLPLFFFLCTIVMIYLNFLALMRLFPLYIALPLLFIAIYLTLFTFTTRNTFQQMRKRNF